MSLSRLGVDLYVGQAIEFTIGLDGLKGKVGRIFHERL